MFAFRPITARLGLGAIDLAERSLIPDVIVRHGIRRLVSRRLREERARAGGDLEAHVTAFVEKMHASPVAESPRSPNEQHYEVPAEFFQAVLGPQLKYSCALWSERDDDLARAEERMLALTGERAGIQNGTQVLDLGCGWGSLALWVARRYPCCRVVAVSNSSSQGDFIRGRCAAEGLDNVKVLTADMNDFDSADRFDRVVSVEMFEHIRNWPALFAKIGRWLRPDGAFLLHVFCHQDLAYRYADQGVADWMARNFFTGGIMPSEDLPSRISSPLQVADHWRVNGLHYSRTLEAWLERMGEARDRLIPLFRKVYGAEAERWFGRWRIFFMACSELFRYRRGTEWFVSQYLLRLSGATPHREDAGSAS
jgi:cyclopropane-fatty-acyl-phospholipid synthase